MGAGVLGDMHLLLANARIFSKRSQEAPAFIIADNSYCFHRHARIEPFDTERKITARTAAMAFFLDKLRDAVFFRPVGHHPVIVNAPCAARDKAAALGFSHDQPAFRTFSVISLSVARARIGVRPLFCKLP